MFCVWFFFFKQKTAYDMRISDWSSDVCSSDLVLRIAQLWQDFQQARLSIDRLGDILNTRSEAVVSSGQQSLPRLNGHIEFDRVLFRYRPDGPEILRHVSLNIPAGHIVGRSEEHKSELQSLMRISYAVFCLKNHKKQNHRTSSDHNKNK